MEQALYIILGAVLALLGGFIGQNYQNHLAQVREDKALLFQAARLLLNFSALLKKKAKYQNSSEYNTQISLEADEISFCDELSNIAIRICTKKYRDLAAELTAFALDDSERNEDNLYRLTKDVQMSINEPMIKKYEARIKNDT